MQKITRNRRLKEGRNERKEKKKRDNIQDKDEPITYK